MSSFTLSSRFRFAKPLLALALGAALATLAACGSDTTNGTGPMDVSGNYSLTTVNSSTLPYTIPHTPGHTIVISSATGTIGAGHSYSINATGTVDGGEPGQVIADAGTYTVSGSTVTFTSSIVGGASYTAAASSGTLTAVVPGAFAGSTDVSITLVFTKS